MESMAARFPWMSSLSAEDQKTCAEELAVALSASPSTQNPQLVAATLTGWKETATALAAGLGNHSVDWVESDIAIERP